MRLASRGFTLIELMVVIAIMGLLAQLVVMNMGALIPKTVLDSDCKQLISQLDYLRSESRLQSKTLKLELDLTNNRYQVILPPEERLESSKPVDRPYELGWRELDQRSVFTGYAVAGEKPFRQGRVKIVFDENGFTADQAIFMRLRDMPELVWTIQIRGLTGRSRLIRDNHGNEHPFAKLEEHQF